MSLILLNIVTDVVERLVYGLFLCGPVHFCYPAIFMFCVIKMAFLYVRFALMLLSAFLKQCYWRQDTSTEELYYVHTQQYIVCILLHLKEFVSHIIIKFSESYIVLGPACLLKITFGCYGKVYTRKVLFFNHRAFICHKSTVYRHKTLKKKNNSVTAAFAFG